MVSQGAKNVVGTENRASEYEAIDDTARSSVTASRVAVGSSCAAPVTIVWLVVPLGTPAGIRTSTTKWTSPPFGGISEVCVMTAPSKMLPSPFGSDHVRTVQP